VAGQRVDQGADLVQRRPSGRQSGACRSDESGGKLEYFKMLVQIGIKEIEVGFPSASQTEYEILRTLIEGNHIPTM
jgi:hypothetical protein